MPTEPDKALAAVDPGQRVLLLSHCLRRTETCQAKYDREGLQCAGCNAACPINQLRQAALKLGYKGVCVAPGGRLAIKYVQEKRPRGIVAVACQKELEEGIQGVGKIAGEARRAIPTVVVPLSKDGCVDTEVDVDLALRKIALGCPAPALEDGG